MLFRKDIHDRLREHVKELELFESKHLSLLPKGWLRVRPIIGILERIDEQAIRDLIELHKNNSDYSGLYPKVMPLLLSLHKDLVELLNETPNQYMEKIEDQVIKRLIDEIKEIITNDEWKDEVVISKIGSSSLIYRKNEDIKLAMMRYFVLADQFKKALSEKLGIEEAWHYVLPLPRDQFIRLYREVYPDVASFEPERVMELVYSPEKIGKGPDKSRVWRFKNTAWTVRTIHIKNIGVWPSFGGTDNFTTSGNLPDTARKIKMILHGKVSEWPSTVKPHIPDKIIHSIYSIRHYADIIYRLFPIVLTEKGKATRRARENKKARERYGFDYSITKYDIEDGDHRAVAFALMGIKKIKCFVGVGLNSDRP